MGVFVACLSSWAASVGRDLRDHCGPAEAPLRRIEVGQFAKSPHQGLTQLHVAHGHVVEREAAVGVCDDCLVFMANEVTVTAFLHVSQVRILDRPLAVG